MVGGHRRHLDRPPRTESRVSPGATSAADELRPWRLAFIVGTAIAGAAWGAAGWLYFQPVALLPGAAADAHHHRDERRGGPLPGLSPARRIGSM